MSIGELEIQKAKQNLTALKVIFNDIYIQGIDRINTVFSEFNRVDNIINNFEPVLNMYTNALYSINNTTSFYFAANIGGYKILLPETLHNKKFFSIRECYDAVYNQATIHLDEYLNKTELYWFNTCWGNVYLPNDFETLRVELNEIKNHDFITNTDPNYNSTLTLAMERFEQSLRCSLSVIN